MRVDCTDFCIGKEKDGLTRLKRGLNFLVHKLELEFSLSGILPSNFFSGLPFVFQAKAPALEVGIKGPPVLLSSSSSVLSIHIPFFLSFSSPVLFSLFSLCSFHVSVCSQD